MNSTINLYAMKVWNVPKNKYTVKVLRAYSAQDALLQYQVMGQVKGKLGPLPQILEPIAYTDRRLHNHVDDDGNLKSEIMWEEL